MACIPFVCVCLLFNFFLQVFSQLSPSYLDSKHFYSNQIKAYLGSGQSRTYNMPSGFPISVNSHRQPFLAVSGAQHMKIQDDQYFYFYIEVENVGSTSFKLKITVQTVSDWFGLNEYGFEDLTNLFIRYLVIDQSFPDIYLSQLLSISSITYSIAAGGFKEFIYNVNTLSGTVSLPISTDTVFIHSLTFFHLTSLKSIKDNSFELTVTFRVVSANLFGLRLNAKYPVAVDELGKAGISVFIYNKVVFNNLYIKIDYQIVTFTNLASSDRPLIYTSLYTPTTVNSLVFGLNGMDLSGDPELGFNFLLNPLPTGNDYTFTLQNLWSATSVPRLDFLILLPSEFRCPNWQTNIDPTLTICYSSCPSHQFTSANQVAISGIYTCANCFSTCSECNISATNCTQCYLSQNRVLTSNLCTPQPGYYEAGIEIAQPCDPNCKTCSLSATNCTSCYNAFYLSANVCMTCESKYGFGCTLCSALVCSACLPSLILAGNSLQCITCSFYHPNCLSCNSTKCHSCDSTQSYVLSTDNSTCISCQSFDSNCISCTNINCLGCNSATGYLLNSTSNTCITCSSYHTQCLTCNSTNCGSCSTTFTLDAASSTCVPCTSYHSQCLTCNSTNCQSCSIGYTLDGTEKTCISCSSFHPKCISCDAISCLQCQTGHFVLSGTCQACSTYFAIQCLNCTPTKCTTCETGYLISLIDFKCFSNTCGDGQWIESSQACDDKNLINGDGCDSECHVQTDYACLLTDKLPTGESFCKFTKDFSITLDNMQKQPNSNTIQMVLNLEPATFKQWTHNDVFNLLAPIQIVDQQTGTFSSVLLNDINVQLKTNEFTNQVELLINYGQANIQGAYLRFNIKPDATNLSRIENLAIHNNLTIKITSDQAGVYLYNYSDETYAFLGLVEAFSNIVGYFAFIMAVLGFIMPVGKLVIVEALAIVQIGYFSIFQFQKVPLTFLPLKNLKISNGYNDLSFVPFQLSGPSQKKFRLLGMKSETLSNFNLSMAIFVLLPIIIGTIGTLINKNRQNFGLSIQVNENSGLKQASLSEQKMSPQLIIKKMIFERILYECSLYGILVTSYLSWASIFHSIPEICVSDYAMIGLISFLYAVFTFLLLKPSQKSFDLKSFLTDSTLSVVEMKKDLEVSTRFGQFSSLHKNFASNGQGGLIQKFYLFYLFERILTTGIIIFLPQFINLTSAILMGIFSLLLAGIIYMRYKQVQSSSAFCYLSKNYALRQGINILTILGIEGLYLAVSLHIQSRGPYETFVSNQMIIKGVPLGVLSLMSANLIFNSFLWVWQIKSSNLILKTKIVYEIIFKKDQKPKKSKKDLKIQIESESSKLEEEEVANMMSNFINSSPMFKQRVSPFLGLEEKASRKLTLNGLVKAIESKTEQTSHQRKQSTVYLQDEQLDCEEFNEL